MLNAFLGVWIEFVILNVIQTMWGHLDVEVLLVDVWAMLDGVHSLQLGLVSSWATILLESLVEKDLGLLLWSNMLVVFNFEYWRLLLTRQRNLDLLWGLLALPLVAGLLLLQLNFWGIHNGLRLLFRYLSSLLNWIDLVFFFLYQDLLLSSLQGSPLSLLLLWTALHSFILMNLDLVWLWHMLMLLLANRSWVHTKLGMRHLSVKVTERILVCKVLDVVYILHVCMELRIVDDTQSTLTFLWTLRSHADIRVSSWSSSSVLKGGRWQTVEETTCAFHGAAHLVIAVEVSMLSSFTHALAVHQMLHYD